MNRRFFQRGLSALGFLPALPVRALATVSAAPVATMPSMTYLYPWAAIYARSQNACSPLMLMQRFDISPQIAAHLYTRLQASGVIGAPGALGLSHATKPHCARLRRGVSDGLADHLRDCIEDAVAADEQTGESGETASEISEQSGGPVRIRT